MRNYFLKLRIISDKIENMQTSKNAKNNKYMYLKLH